MPKFSAYMKGGDGSAGPPGASIIDGVLANEDMLPIPNQGKYAFLVGTSNPKHLWVWNDQKEGENKWEDQGPTASEINKLTASISTVAWDVSPSITTQFSTSDLQDSFNFDFNIPMGRPAGFGDFTATISSTNWDAEPAITTSADGEDWEKNIHYDFTLPVGRPAGFGEINVTTQSLSSDMSPWVTITTDDESPDWAKDFNFNFGIPKGIAAGFSTGQYVSVSTLDTGEDATVEITTVTSSPETAKEFNFHFGLPRGDALAIYEGVPFTTDDGLYYHWDTTNTTTLVFDRGTVEKLPIYIYNNNTNESIAATFKLSVSTIEYEADEKFNGTMYLAMPATLQNIEIGKVSSTTYEYEPVVSKSTGSTSTNLILDFIIPKGEKSDEIYDVSSGKITNFIATNAPVGDLIVDIEPVQDLHGYDHPWPAGGGKNKLPLPVAETKNGITLSYNSDGSVKITGTASANTYFDFFAGNFDSTAFVGYKFSGLASSITGVTFRISESDRVAIQSAYTEFTILDNGSGLYFAIRVEVGTALPSGGVTVYPMLISPSESDTLFTPYSNICPISGWTGMNVQRTGKNLFDFEGWLTDVSCPYTKSGNTYTISPDNSDLFLDPFYFSQTNVTISASVKSLADVTSNNIRMELLDATGNRISNKTINPLSLKRENESAAGIRINWSLRGSFTIEEPQIELGSTATSYEPYQGTTYPISWQTEAGTVYGGSLDVTTGVLTVDKAGVDLGTLTWIYYNSLFIASDIPNMAVPATPDDRRIGIISSIYPVSVTTVINDTMTDKSMLRANGYLYVHDSAYSDITTFKTAMSGMYLVYELATPITYQLTPTEVTTLLGLNNLWADTGNNEILYFKNTEDGKSTGQILNNILTLKTNEAPLNDKAYTRLNGQWTTNITSYGYCTTAIDTVAKTVSIPNFQLVIGSTIFVKFQNANNASNPTLNVNSTGAKPIYRYGTTAASTSSDTNGWRAGSVLALTYDGTGWIEHYWYNNTYALANNYIGSGNFTADSAIYRYQLLVHTDREHLSPFNNNNNVTATTKTILTNIEFDPFEQIYYYDSSTTVNANSLIGGNALAYTKENIDLRIVFNIDDNTSPLTLHKDVYMKVTPLSNGKVKLASAMPLVQELPSTNDGYWYIFLGRATTRAYGLTLYLDKPVFYHDGTRIRQKFNPYIEKDFRCYHVTATIPQGTTKSFTVTGCTPTMRIINCVFKTPNNIASGVQWTTAANLVKFDGTFTGNTDVEFDLIESDTLTAIAI